jgi:hypothetical protein
MADAGRDVKHILITMTVTIPLPIPESRSAIINWRIRNLFSDKLANKWDTASHRCVIPRPSRRRQNGRMPAMAMLLQHCLNPVNALSTPDPLISRSRRVYGSVRNYRRCSPYL